MTRFSSRARALGVLAALAVTMAACGSDTESAADTTAATDTAAATTVAATSETTAATDVTASVATDAPTTTAAALPVVPDGTKLRVGDQSRSLELPLGLSGEAEEVQAEIEYSTFAAGPPLIEAFNAGAIDLGYVGDAPPVLAHARGQDIVIVGAWHYNPNLIAIVAGPGKEIGSVADLAGKQLAYTRGTALQAFAIRALEEAGLTESDIEPVDLPILDIVGALKSGDVDAAVLVEPILSPYLTETPDATVVRDGEGVSSGLQLLITTRATLEDPAKEAAIGDYLARQITARRWIDENPEAYAQAYAEANQISIEAATSLIERNGARPIVPIDETIFGEIQPLIDAFAKAGAIPEAYDATELFDDRFNPIVEAAS